MVNFPPFVSKEGELIPKMDCSKIKELSPLTKEKETTKMCSDAISWGALNTLGTEKKGPTSGLQDL